MTEPVPYDLAVIGAHPLDAEILGGAVAAKVSAAGGRAILVHVTDGAGNYPELDPVESIRKAHAEAKRAARILGCEIFRFDFPSLTLYATGIYRAVLARYLGIWQPRLIITHWRGSWHERHRITHRLVLNAIASANITPAVYYGENFEDLDGFRPTHYVDTTDVCARWWRALESYNLVTASRRIAPDDHTTFPYHSYYHAAPRVRGLESGLPLAHALQKHGRRPTRQVVDDVL